MNPSERMQVIRQRLEQQFSPSQLDIIDDSEKHKGHPGSAGGAGHYTVLIAGACFAGRARVAVHRDIYDSLKDLIPDEVHALRIQILNP